MSVQPGQVCNSWILGPGAHVRHLERAKPRTVTRPQFWTRSPVVGNKEEAASADGQLRRIRAWRPWSDVTEHLGSIGNAVTIGIGGHPIG